MYVTNTKIEVKGLRSKLKKMSVRKGTFRVRRKKR